MDEPDRRRSGRRPRVALPSIGSDRVLPWIVRVLWVALPFTAGPALAEAVDGTSGAVQLVASAGLWAGWAIGVVASFVALPISLTALRVVGPAALVSAIIAAATGPISPLAVGWTGVATGWVFSPSWGALCVNGPAYPNERRFLLRAPGPLLFGPLVVAWSLAMSGLAAGPLLLASRQWILGGLLTIVGVPLAGALLRGLHDLSRRWVVMVPAGLVVHDPLTVVDPVLLRRQSIRRLAPALAGTDALDLTQKAPGLALAVDLSEEVQLSLVRLGRRVGNPVRASRLLLTPTRPGALLDHAGRRRLPVR